MFLQTASYVPGHNHNTLFCKPNILEINMHLSRLFAPIALASALGFATLSTPALADTTLRIGVTPVPHADVVNFIKPQLAKEGVNLEVIEFNDYVQPNLALDSGDIDANYFQTIPYLEEMVKQHKLNLHILVSVHLEPMALYSKTVKNLADIPNGAKIAIPSDPTNEGRALKVLEHAGLIKLKDGATLLSSPADIVENPKNLKFLELEPALLPRALDDVVAAVINANYALEAGFNNLPRNSPSNAKRWVGMDSGPSFSSAIFDFRCTSLSIL